MTEQDWLTCSDPVRLLEYLDRPQGDRKLLLFALACCRAIWPLLPQPEMRAAVEVAERFADGKATREELEAADWQLEGALYGGVEYYANRPNLSPPTNIAAWLADVQAIPAGRLRAMAGCGSEELPDYLILLKKAGYFADHVLTMNACYPHSPALEHFRRFLQVSLIRDIFGNPFEKTLVKPSILVWKNSTITCIAAAIYNEGAFDRFPIIADALREAGCTDEVLLKHCCQPTHVRGCWLIDQLLGKK